MVARGIIAVIPARGGSKRVPGKNTYPFQGRPMIAWTIEAAVESKLFERVLVSTDDGQIAAVGREWGAEVPFLRDQAADDLAPVSQATHRAIEQAEEHFGESYESVCQLMPNCPLRTAADIVESHAEFQKAGNPFQVSCFRFGWMNPWWAARLDRNQRPISIFPEAEGKRSQDLEPLYCPTGAIWWARVADLRASSTFYGPGHRFQPIDWKSAIDIDDFDDLEMANAVFLLDREE